MKTSKKRTKKSPFGIDEHFGGCPKCGLHDGFINVHAEHWFFCRRHKTKWCGGENLFGLWRLESREDWRQNHQFLANFTKVEPVRSADELQTSKSLQNSPHELASKPANHICWSNVVITYHGQLEREFNEWAGDCRWEPKALRRVSELAIRERHNEAYIQVAHRATDSRPDVYTLEVDDIAVYYSIESNCILIRGFGYDATGYPADDLDGGGFYI